MAFSKSGWYTQSLLYMLQGTTMTGGTTPMVLASSSMDSQNYISLIGAGPTDYAVNVATGGATTAIAWAGGSGTPNYEIFGTGWATGGIAMSAAAAGSTSVTTTATQFGSGPYGIQYGWTNPVSVASTTLTGIYGFIIYNHAATAPVTKPQILLIYVGTGYNTVAGTFGITPSGSGLSQLTLTA
jgi:hypothetical protein